MYANHRVLVTSLEPALRVHNTMMLGNKLWNSEPRVPGASTSVHVYSMSERSASMIRIRERVCAHAPVKEREQGSE